MLVRISEATTCFNCGIQTPYEVKEIKQATSLLDIKLRYLSKFKNCKVMPNEQWEKRSNGNYCLVIYGTPMINGKYQGCTSVEFEIIK